MLKVEGDLGKSIVEFGILEDEIEVVRDAVFADN